MASEPKRTEPELTPKSEVPDEVRALCERVNEVADGLPVLIFVPAADHSRLYPLVVIRDGATEHARLVSGYLEGARAEPPPEALRRRHDALLEAIHAAADYLPCIVFLPAVGRLHPVNLVPETVPEPLRPCYLAVQNAQRGVIGKRPLIVAEHVRTDADTRDGNAAPPG